MKNFGLTQDKDSTGDYDYFITPQLIAQYKANVAKSPALQQWIKNNKNPLLQTLLPKKSSKTATNPTLPLTPEEEEAQKEIAIKYELKEAKQDQEIQQHEQLMEAKQGSAQKLVMFSVVALAALGILGGIVFYVKSRKDQLAALHLEHLE